VPVGAQAAIKERAGIAYVSPDLAWRKLAERGRDRKSWKAANKWVEARARARQAPSDGRVEDRAEATETAPGAEAAEWDEVALANHRDERLQYTMHVCSDEWTW